MVHWQPQRKEKTKGKSTDQPQNKICSNQYQYNFSSSKSLDCKLRMVPNQCVKLIGKQTLKIVNLSLKMKIYIYLYWTYIYISKISVKMSSG